MILKMFPFSLPSRFIKSYRASGTFVKTCGEDGNWHGDDDGICISEYEKRHRMVETVPFHDKCHDTLEYPTPKLICPLNTIVELPPFSDEVEVKLQRPKTDLNIKRDVSIRPSWIRGERVFLKRGNFNVTYTARHPISKITSSCTTTIYVIGE